MATEVVKKKGSGVFYKAVFVVDILYNQKYSHSKVLATCFLLVIKTCFTFVWQTFPIGFQKNFSKNEFSGIAILK